MIKILFFIETLNGGGAEKVLQNLVNAMDQGEFDITVQTLYPDEAAKKLADGIKFRYCYSSASGFNRLVMRLEAAAGLTYPLHIKGDYDIEVAYLECGSTKIMAGSTNKKAKKIAWVHCDLSKKFADSADFPAKAQKIYDKFDSIVCVSQSVKAGFEKLFGKDERISVIYNTVNDKEIIRLADADTVVKSEPTVLAVGRLSKQKRFDRLISAHKKLIDEGVKHRLMIMGEGVERAPLEKLISDLSLSGSVELIGYRENPYPYIKAADVCVCSSDYEGISTFITESLILGKVIVTTDCSGMRELLGNSEFGIITDSDDKALARGIKAILTDEALKKNYEEKARKRGEDFSEAQLTQITETFLKNLIK